MRKFNLSLIWMVLVAMPTLNAQQVSPSQNTTTQQASKPKARGIQTSPQPRVQPTQTTAAANNNPGRDKRIANNPGHGKPAVNHPGNVKPADNKLGNGKTSHSSIGRGQVAKDNRDSYADAMRRYRHDRHDCDWWKQHYVVIVLVGGGYYYHDAGYWYPAWGYDANYERYDYDGPIYTYGNLLPDQVIVNVQRALNELGYYAGELNGSLGVNTRNALAAYQQDYGLDATGVVDEATVRALGLI
jgi:Putative peptidoglycan binding domain